jgi:imidazolonepropionase-like amidohydrolase
MKRSISALFVLLLCYDHSLANESLPLNENSAPVTVFSEVRVFDGERVLSDATVVVQGDRITQVLGKGETYQAPPGARFIEGAGKTLMPGLIDSHTHTFSRQMLERAMDFGVTTTLDMWTSASFVQAIRIEDQNGVALDRADMLSSTVGATAPESHGTQFGPTPTLSKAEDSAGFVADRVADGADYIKIIYDNFKMIDSPVPTLDRDTLNAVVQAAHAQGKMAVAHSRDVEAYSDVAEAGANGIVHAPVDAIPDGMLIKLLSEKGLFVIPTLSISTPSGPRLADDPSLGERLSEKELANLRNYSPMHNEGGDQISMDAVAALHRAGIPILAGSDSPNLGTTTGASIHQELELLVKAGLSPSEALSSATSLPAEAFGLKDRGRIAPGYRADLLLVDGDPTRKITDTRKIVSIWKAGSLFNSGK